MSRVKINYALLIGFLLFGLTTFSQHRRSHHAKEMSFNLAKAPSPLFRDPVFDGAADPSMIWDDINHQWLIFYTQRRASLNLEGVAYCYGTGIGIASSTDAGETWRYLGTADLPQPDSGLNSFWAPQVFQNPADKKYHMLVSYIKGVYTDWGGERQLFHYISDDLKSWQQLYSLGLSGCIDASTFQLADGSWKVWYKDESKESFTYASKSTDLLHWTRLDTCEVQYRHHEAPIVFQWKGYYWMITDPTYDNYTGLDVFVSSDATHWTFNNTILNEPGSRPDDNDQGRHADVKIVNDQAIIVYFTHPGRIYPNNQNEDPDNGVYRYRRSSLHVAELELIEGKIICNRDKYKKAQQVY